MDKVDKLRKALSLGLETRQADISQFWKHRCQIRAPLHPESCWLEDPPTELHLDIEAMVGGVDQLVGLQQIVHAADGDLLLWLEAEDQGKLVIHHGQFMAH